MGQSREGQIWSAADEVPIFYRTYPGQKSDYYYAIIHGFAEHSGRYTKLVECLQGTGRSVLVYDLRGHGRSGGERGGLTSWNQYWDDFHGLSAFLISRSELPASKTILLGHSLGGLIALDGTLRDGTNIGGLILSSPCLGLPLSAGLVFLNGIMARLFPDFSYARPVKPEDLSRDSAVGRAYLNDPLILKRIRAKTLAAMIQAGDSLDKSMLQLDQPVWVLAAGNERVVDLKRTLKIYAKLQAPFKKLKVFEAFRHEIFNEVQSEIAYDTVLQAIEQIIDFNSRSGKSII